MLAQPVLAALLVQSSELLVVSDARGAITWTNPAWRERTGWDDCIGALLPPCLAPDAGQAAPQLQAVLEQALRLGRLEDTVVQLHAPGSATMPPPTDGLWLRLRIGSVGASRLWTMRDIGDARRAEAESRRLGELLDMAQEFGRLGVWERDIATGRGHWDAHVFRYWGIDPADGTPDFDQAVRRIHPDDRLQHVYAESTATPGRYAQRYRVFQPDGSLRWLHSQWEIKAGPDGAPSHAVGVIVDDTEVLALARSLDDATTQLVQANERILLATRGAGIGTWEHDLRSDEVRWDEQMYRLRGLEPPTDPQQDSHAPMRLRRSLAHPDELPLLLEANRIALAERQMASYEFRVRWPDGSYRWLASRSVADYDAEGRPLRQIGVNWDVHERVSAEAVRREALAAQRQNEARSQFFARMSHELRTPLNAILGFTQLLELEAEGGTEAAAAAAGAPGAQGQRVKLRLIRHAAEHLLTLVNEVLDLTSLEAGALQAKAEPVALDALLAEVHAAVEAEARQGAITLQVECSGLTVLADRERLHHLLLKLLDQHIRQLTPGTRFIAWLPLATAPPSGLAASLAQARLHSGTADAASPSGASPAGGAERSATPDRVLYIEDNPVNVILVQELIAQRGGLDLVCEPTGSDGVARARQLRPQLVLIDMQLPDIDGFEVLRRLRADPLTAGIRCIALSANAMPEDMARAIAAGFDDYWTKPIRFERFIGGLDRLFPRPGKTLA